MPVRLLAIASLACLVLAAGAEPQRLQSEADRIAFRNWFAFLAEAQYFTAPASRAPEVIDCSSLVRYAYREALRRHDSRWAASANLPLIPSIPSVSQYNFPHTPQGPRLFETGPQQYAEFADAQTLYRYNVFPVQRDIKQARRGDLLFFRQQAGTSPYHTMIVLEKSQIADASARFVVYDTGPDGTRGGQIKRLTISELLQFPDRRWRPVPENTAFLGAFRWNILKD